MTVLYLLLLVVAAVLFALSAISERVHKHNLVAAGLFFFTLVAVLQTMQKL